MKNRCITFICLTIKKMQKSSMKTVIAKCILSVLAFGPFLWLSWLSAAPGGERTVSWTPGERSPFIQAPLPAERVSGVNRDDRGAFVTIQSEPVYFSVFPPAEDFTSATVRVAFEPHDAFAVELGGLVNVAAYAFDFRSLANRVAENLSWKKLANEEGSSVLTVFAKEDVKASVQDFLAHPPPSTTIATYRATLPGVYRDPFYTPLGITQKFSTSLRGSHEYVTYLKDEPFFLDIFFQDINRTYGPDDGYVRVYNEEGRVMVEEIFTDDGNSTENQVFASRSILLEGRDWPEGVYRVELSGTSDVVWRTLVTKQRFMAFKNRLYIADDVGYLPQDRQTTFVTSSTSMTFETFHADSAHRVVFGQQIVDIPQSHVKISSEIEAGALAVGITDAGDIKMTGERKISLSKAAFFDPDPAPLTVKTDLENSLLRYVVSSSSPKEYDGDWRVASTAFDMKTLAQEFGAYKFALSLPGFATDGEAIDLHSVTVTFVKEPISLLRAVKNEYHRWRKAIDDRFFAL